MSLLKDLQGLNAAYAEMQKKEAYTVTAADKKGNTPAWQGYKAGKKNVKTGKPLYRAADHLKNEELEVEVDEGYGKIKTPEKVVGKVRQPKNVAAPKGSKMKQELISPEVEKLIESGLFSVEEIAKIAGIEIDEAQSSYDKARKAAARRAADRNAARRRGELGGRMERETYTSEGGKRMHYKGYTARDGE